MDQPPDVPPFLDRTQKGSTVTEQSGPKRERRAILRLVVEYDHAKSEAEVKALIETARAIGTIRVAKLTGLPSSANLA